MALHRHPPADRLDDRIALRPEFAVDGSADSLPRFRLPEGPMAASSAYRHVHDELLLDGNARLNLATFVTTWMEPEAERLIAECLEKNMIDKDEYPQTAELEQRCIAMLADLWNADVEEHATGCSTTGSSEACMLGGIALLRTWRQRRTASGQDATRPNLVMGTNVQVCWEKFCRYWDVEPRMVPVTSEHPHLTAAGAAAACDEHTIGVVAILGSTFDGSYEPVADIAAALDARADRDGIDVAIHVDAASGGFIAPFLDPDLLWDFRLPRVRSINASGHKYGLVYPGIGWALWRNDAALPEDLVFHVDYLGGDMPTFALNFSRPGAQVVAQYYEFVRLGFEGYRQVQAGSRATAMWLARAVADLGPFELVSDGSDLPVFAFRLAADVEGFTVFDVSELLRGRGWLVPAYHFPADLEGLAVLRVVVRNGFGRDLAELFVRDLARVVERLRRGGGRDDATRTAFHH